MFPLPRRLWQELVRTLPVLPVQAIRYIPSKLVIKNDYEINIYFIHFIITCIYLFMDIIL